MGHTPLSAVAAEQPIRKVGTFSPIGGISAVRVVLASQQRILYAIAGAGAVRAYDLDSLQPLGEEIPFTVHQAGKAVVDDRTGELIVPTGVYGYGGGPATQLERFGVTGRRLTANGSIDVATALAGRNVTAMTFDDSGRFLYLLSTAGQSPVEGTTALTQVDMRGPDGAALARWTQPLPQCLAPAYSSSGLNAVGYVSQPPALAFGCRGWRSELADKTPVPQPQGAALLNLQQGADGAPIAGAFELVRFPMNFATPFTASFYDPASDRLVLTGGEGNYLYALVYDATIRAFVGKASLGYSGMNIAGFDREKGRFYAVGRELKVVDVRATPVGQGLAFAEPATDGGAAPAAIFEVDTVTSRIFTSFVGQPHLTILQDDLPPYTPPSPGNPDAATIDTPEDPATTGALFSGGAQGYGARYRMVGGIGALQLNLTGLESTPMWRPGQRELRAAWLDHLGLADDGAAARAIALDRDQETSGKDQQDAELTLAPIRGDAPLWPYGHAQCRDFGATPEASEVEGASTACDNGDRSAEARATFDRLGAPGITVGRSSVEGSSHVDPKRGLVTTVVSTAEHVSIGDGAVTIGRITAVATAIAKGRPGTAGATFERHIHDVEVDGKPQCGSRGNGECPIDRVREIVNQAVGGTVRIDFPQPDADLAKGSPGGYRAAIRRPVVKNWEAVALDGEYENRFEVPAMTLTLSHDNRTAGRLLVELAGAAVEAHYGIFVRSAFEGLDDGFPSAAAPATGTPTLTGDDAVGLMATIDVLGPARQHTARPSGVDRLIDAIPGARLVFNALGWVGPTFAMWLLFLAPVYFSARRNELLHRSASPLGRAQ